LNEIAVRGGNGKRRRNKKLNPDELIRRLRVGDLNKLFALRYGGNVADCAWQFPDDDAGLDDLKILAHHYAGNPIAAPRIIKLRAPWADVEAILEEVVGDPKRWRSKTLGKYLNLSGKEWRALRPRTIAPVDMTPEERADYSRILSNGRRLKKRRSKGMQRRADYLAANSLSRDKPWVAEGISRRTWERRRRRDASLAEIKITMDRTDLRQQGWTGQNVSSQESDKAWLDGLRSPTQKPPLPDLCQDPNFNPILSWLCLKAAYHQQMRQLCDEVANAEAA
jgi:hypothetical protein